MVSFIVFGLWECIFKLYFCSKNGHNSVENDRTGKIFTLVLKTTYKKVFLKYQVNTWFPSLCLASGNAKFSGGRRKNSKKKKKKKSRQAHRDPVRGRDAPMNQMRPAAIVIKAAAANDRR